MMEKIEVDHASEVMTLAQSWFLEGKEKNVLSHLCENSPKVSNNGLPWLDLGEIKLMSHRTF